MEGEGLEWGRVGQVVRRIPEEDGWRDEGARGSRGFLEAQRQATSKEFIENGRNGEVGGVKEVTR